MGLIKVKDGSGGAELEVLEPATLNQLIQEGEISPSTTVYDVQTKQKIDDNTILQPGRTYGNTVVAEYGA